MKRQMLKGYPWPEEKHSIAIRKAVIDDGMYLIVDFVSDKPQLRVCIGKKEYANYYPEGTRSLFWARKMRHTRFYQTVGTKSRSQK